MGPEAVSLLRAQMHCFRDVLSLMPLVRTGAVAGLRRLPAGEGQAVHLQSDGLRLVGSYRPAHVDGTREDGGLRPGLVITHGASSRGRRLPLVQVLAWMFQQRGYHVLCYDARCYGESDHPPTPDDEAMFDFSRDVIEAVDWLAARPEVDGRRVFVLGHSFGAGAALDAQAYEPRIAKLALFGPPRRLTERYFAEGAPDRLRITARIQHDLNVPYRIAPEVIGRVLAARDIERHIYRFQSHDHVPLLLLDAEQEDPADRAFLHAVHARMSGRAKYWTVPGTDHYLNTARVLGRVVYHPERVTPFVDAVDRFLRS
ncbi:MAG: alpha/beta fold hydrolase [Phycisphaeraceae bacterium]